MFRAVYRSSSGALIVFATSGLHTHVVTGRSQVLDYGRSPHAYVNQRLQIQLELLMMSGIPLKTCCPVNERWNNKFCYKVAPCWLFLLSHNTMHESINTKLLYFRITKMLKKKRSSLLPEQNQLRSRPQSDIVSTFNAVLKAQVHKSQ